MYIDFITIARKLRDSARERLDPKLLESFWAADQALDYSRRQAPQGPERKLFRFMATVEASLRAHAEVRLEVQRLFSRAVSLPNETVLSLREALDDSTDWDERVKRELDDAWAHLRRRVQKLGDQPATGSQETLTGQPGSEGTRPTTEAGVPTELVTVFKNPFLAAFALMLGDVDAGRGPFRLNGVTFDRFGATCTLVLEEQPL
jgi:hypothetical protein